MLSTLSEVAELVWARERAAPTQQAADAAREPRSDSGNADPVAEGAPGHDAMQAEVSIDPPSSPARRSGTGRHSSSKVAGLSRLHGSGAPSPTSSPRQAANGPPEIAAAHSDAATTTPAAAGGQVAAHDPPPGAENAAPSEQPPDVIPARGETAIEPADATDEAPQGGSNAVAAAHLLPPQASAPLFRPSSPSTQHHHPALDPGPQLDLGTAAGAIGASSSGWAAAAGGGVGAGMPWLEGSLTAEQQQELQQQMMLLTGGMGGADLVGSSASSPPEAVGPQRPNSLPSLLGGSPLPSGGGVGSPLTQMMAQFGGGGGLGSQQDLLMMMQGGGWLHDAATGPAAPASGRPKQQRQQRAQDPERQQQNPAPDHGFKYIVQVLFLLFISLFKFLRASPAALLFYRVLPPIFDLQGRRQVESASRAHGERRPTQVLQRLRQDPGGGGKRRRYVSRCRLPEPLAMPRVTHKHHKMP